VTELAVDCADPRALARFWCAVLGHEVRHEEDGLVTIGPPGAAGSAGRVLPAVTFAHVPEGRTGRNRLHLDLAPTDRAQHEEVARLLDLGARPADAGHGGRGRVGLADPEGNGFCVLPDRLPDRRP
jgi:catechol 2,3-dioxygenase-like lactoylglutathione lyase family enzyme